MSRLMSTKDNRGVTSLSIAWGKRSLEIVALLLDNIGVRFADVVYFDHAYTT